MKLRVSGVVLLLMCVFGLESSQALRLSRDDYTQQYTDKFIADFPTTITRRTVISKWCSALLDPQLPDYLKAGLEPARRSREQIEGWTYSGEYIAPNQSLLAYTLCHPYVNGKLFDANVTTLFKTLKYDDLFKGQAQINKNCEPVSSNNLNNCDLSQLATDLTVMLFNDLTNLRLGRSRGYMGDSATDQDVIDVMTQYFGDGVSETGNKFADYIASINTFICKTQDVIYLGNQYYEHCGFPDTYNYIINNAKLKGKAIFNKATLVNPTKLLSLGCDMEWRRFEIVGCGINDRRSIQSFNAMLYNELWVYRQFMGVYLGMNEIRADVLVGNNPNLDQSQQSQLLRQLKNRIVKQVSQIDTSAKISSNLVGQMESYYGIHLGMQLIKERSTKAMTNYLSQWQNTLKSWLGDRNNTQVASNKKNGTSAGTNG